jgi:pimeloyl-ACP methyl ester carboxylesterase
MWDMVIPSLCAQGFIVLRYDVFGHGRSSCDPSIRFTMGSFVLQLQELTSTVLPEAQPIVLVGFSLGGLISLKYACTHPGRERCETLVLLDSCGLAGVTLSHTRSHSHAHSLAHSHTHTHTHFHTY